MRFCLFTYEFHSFIINTVYCHKFFVIKFFSIVSTQMSDHTPEEAHLRHCMLYEFRKGSKATEATKNICEVYGDVLDVSVGSVDSDQAIMISQMDIVRDDRLS